MKSLIVRLNRVQVSMVLEIKKVYRQCRDAEELIDYLILKEYQRIKK